MSVKNSCITILLLLLFSACNYVETGKPATTPSFDSALVKEERMYNAGNKKEAFQYLLSVHATAKGLTMQDEMNYFAYIGSIYRRDLNDYDKYIACADSIIQLLDKHRYVKDFTDKYYVLAYNMKADGMSASGMYNESYEYYYKSKSLAQKTGDSCSLSFYNYNLGMVTYRQQKYADAAALFAEAFRESQFCADDFGHFYFNQELLDNIGLSYYGAHNYDSALLYYSKAIAYIDAKFLKYGKTESVYTMAKAVVYGNMGNVYMAINKHDTAISLLNKSIEINLGKGYANSDALLEQAKLATIYYNTGRIPEMKVLLTDIKAELDTLPNKNVELSWNKLMWNYYDHTGDSVNAYRYARNYLIQNDSFLTRNKELMASDLAGRIRGLERQNHISVLKRKSELGRLYLAIAVVTVILSLIIIVLVLRNARRSKKNVATLTKLNNKVNEQNERLEGALNGLEEKDKDKSRILRSVAHDVMNPITAIQSLAELLLSEADGFNAEQLEMLGMIKEACNNSLSLSRDILQAAVNMTPSDLEKEQTDINELVDSSVKLAAVQAAAKHQKISFTAAQDHIIALVDRKKIWRVINNLLGNAVKFSYENSEIRVHLEQKDQQVHISIADCGIGIPEKNKKHIFDMFTEVKLPGTSGERPNGLGLSISLRIAKAHSGDIWFESEQGKGTTFHLVFPV